MVNGASSSVGSAAVQLAKAFDAQVSVVYSTANLAMVSALGAEHVIDYTWEDFTQRQESYDLIFDAVGKLSNVHCKGSLNPQGAYLTTVPTPGVLLQMLRSRFGRGKRTRSAAAGLRPAREKVKDLEQISAWIKTGKLRAVIDRCYPLEQMAAAYAYV